VVLEQVGGLVSLLVWFAFGALAIPILVEGVDLRIALYAILSLTLVRMVPVAIACVGAGLDRWTVLFIGWFGPRGLASLVFALLALEELGPPADGAVSIIGLTVLVSVLAHGLTARPLSSRYGRVVASPDRRPTTEQA
jgi:sodium/hydrogen antiporter